MKVELNPEKGYCLVTREPGDKAYYGIQNAAGESKLLYDVKKILNQQGYNFIKKRMWKDGHLVDDLQQYLTERKPVGKRLLAIYNNFWALRGAEEDYNKGEVQLMVENLYKEKEK